MGTQEAAPEPSGARSATGAKPAARGRCAWRRRDTTATGRRGGDLCLQVGRVPDELRFRLRVRRPHTGTGSLTETLTTSLRTRAYVRSSRTCQAALPLIWPPSVLHSVTANMWWVIVPFVRVWQLQYKLNLLSDNQQLRWRGRRSDVVTCERCGSLPVMQLPGCWCGASLHAVRVTRPSCSGGTPEYRSITSAIVRVKLLARLPHLMSVGSTVR